MGGVVSHAPTNQILTMPPDTPEYMRGAWVGALRYAIGAPEILDAFERDTGIHWRHGRTPIDRMIDEATGADRQFLAAFVTWFNANVWGPIDPERV